MMWTGWNRNSHLGWFGKRQSLHWITSWAWNHNISMKKETCCLKFVELTCCWMFCFQMHKRTSLYTHFHTEYRGNYNAAAKNVDHHWLMLHQVDLHVLLDRCFKENHLEGEIDLEMLTVRWPADDWWTEAVTGCVGHRFEAPTLLTAWIQLTKLKENESGLNQ